jgi:outer membrane protein assembly factor BamA
VVNDSIESSNGGERHYYRYDLTRITGIVAIQRRIAGPLRAHAGAQWRRYRLHPLGGAPTLLGDDIKNGVTSDTGSYTSVEIHGALIFDTRDEEASPSRGILVAAMVNRALKGAGDFDYIRWGAEVREFIPLASDSSVVLALRQAVELARGRLPFCVAYERLTIWRPEDGFGGETTLRQNLPGRWLGPNNALASVDLRYKWLDAAIGLTPIRLWLVVHADAGRVWNQDERFRWSGLHSGYGAGAIAQLGRSSFFGLELGYSPDAHVQFSTTVTLGY